MSSAWARGLSIDCGCFGGGGATSDPQYLPEILRDLLFLGLATWLVAFPASRWALDHSGLLGTGDRGIVDEILDEEEADDVADPVEVIAEDEPTTAADPTTTDAHDGATRR